MTVGGPKPDVQGTVVGPEVAVQNPGLAQHQLALASAGMTHYSKLAATALDVPAADHDRELAFWQAACGQRLERDDELPEYHGTSWPGHDLLLLVQRLGDGQARVHMRSGGVFVVQWWSIGDADDQAIFGEKPGHGLSPRLGAGRVQQLIARALKLAASRRDSFRVLHLELD
jgi:Glyoxalase-like domain